MTVGMNAIETDAPYNRRTRVVHLIEKNELWVGLVQINGDLDRRDVSKFDLLDPRSIPAAVRSFCRRMGKQMPSFEVIDEVLVEGVPEWLLET